MDGKSRYRDPLPEELIDGQKIVKYPNPGHNHNCVSSNIRYLFHTYLKGKSDITLGYSVSLFLTDKDIFLPDFMIIRDRSIIGEMGIYGAPELVGEVLAPSTAFHDRWYKMRLYEKAGVKEYWIVSVEEKSIEQYFLVDGKFVLNDVYCVYPDWMLEDLSEDERNEIVTEFKCSLYDDFTIKLDEIFDRLV